jgi:hypothetical protein
MNIDEKMQAGQTLTITTTSGSVYIFYGGRFSKNGRESDLIVDLFFFDPQKLGIVRTWQEFHGTVTKIDTVDVGLCMFVSGQNDWWLSSPITSIEENEND